MDPESNKQLPIFDFEDDESLSHSQHMIAGAIAGLTEHTCMFPFDTIKTRMQSYVGARDYASSSIFRVAKSVVSKEGIASLWRGIGPIACSAGPAHAIYFATYEIGKESIGGNKPGSSPILNGIAGGLAILVHDSIMTPMDSIKQRMQLGASHPASSSFTVSKNYSLSFFHTIHRVYTSLGLKGFYAGFNTTIIMNIPFTTVQFTLYEFLKSSIIQYRQIDEYSYSASSHCFSGAVAGGCASALTNPLDVVKTRLQTQGEIGARRYKNMTDCLRTIYLEEGTRGFLRGIRPRILFHAPAAAVSWTTYELFKHLFSQNLSSSAKIQSRAEESRKVPTSRMSAELI